MANGLFLGGDDYSQPYYASSADDCIGHCEADKQGLPDLGFARNPSHNRIAPRPYPNPTLFAFQARATPRT
ncbi:hypothetical protein PISMIDRAFT_671787 [Pisolithus microcarpus 441]|uniref:Uncharacterized protein n=1 Tax=Pisolithus microcarpus 441 TaxID=765257 RepID=A0A0C9YXH1_9AGAM|nr:hypothetical protein PISMIDRAFT_671787 [Pisolithus microcarpus 441]